MIHDTSYDNGRARNHEVRSSSWDEPANQTVGKRTLSEALPPATAATEGPSQSVDRSRAGGTVTRDGSGEAASAVAHLPPRYTVDQLFGRPSPRGGVDH